MRLTLHAPADILTRMMSDAVRILRIALSIKMALAALAALFIGVRFDLVSSAAVLITIVPTLVVWVCAMIPAVERRLGRTYLPVFIVLVIAAQAVESGLDAFTAPLAFTAAHLASPLGARLVEPLFLLLVMTVLGAWAYGRRGGWLTAGLATGLHLISTIIVVTLGVASALAFPVLGLQVTLLFLVGTVVGVLADQQRKQTEALSAANAKLREQAAAMEQLTIARERNRLARDLHDTLAHSLAGLVVQLSAVDTLTPSEPDAARREIATARRAAQAGLEEARRAIRDLRANPVEDLGLMRALERAALDFGERAGVKVDVRVSESPSPLSGDIAATILRIAQEALNNVEKHAGARRVDVALAQSNGWLTLDVRDDGRGFDEADVDGDRFGLRGMRERAEMIGAELQVASGVGRGTSVRLTLPLK